ncbi:MAG: hypothetical protein GC137_07480 [Alphaproteobacteria bacterium]|nr:hypothetical protein [Alphaproteobacteria bacterium]
MTLAATGMFAIALTTAVVPDASSNQYKDKNHMNKTHMNKTYDNRDHRAHGDQRQMRTPMGTYNVTSDYNMELHTNATAHKSSKNIGR